MFFWPWMEPLFTDNGEDISPVLGDAFAGAKMQATLPRALRTDVIQILIILEHMLRALNSGRMRWSLRRRAHFLQASRLCFLIDQGRAPKEGESFESLYRAGLPFCVAFRPTPTPPPPLIAKWPPGKIPKQ